MRKIFIILLVPVILAGCEKYDLTSSIFIPDRDNPDLPAYTEWGYNTFGVLVDRKPFVSDRSGIPAKIISTGGITTFELIGSIKENFSSDNRTRLIIELPYFQPSEINDLLDLDNVTISLSMPECRVYYETGDTKRELDILSGNLLFRRAQNLLVDKKQEQVILSGTFAFQALLNGSPVSFSSGRFDIGFGYDNFFRY